MWYACASALCVHMSWNDYSYDVKVTYKKACKIQIKSAGNEIFMVDLRAFRFKVKFLWKKKIFEWIPLNIFKLN